MSTRQSLVGRPAPVFHFLPSSSRPLRWRQPLCPASRWRAVRSRPKCLGSSVARSRTNRLKEEEAVTPMEATKGSTVNIPVEAPQFLGLRPGEVHSPEEIQRAFDRLEAEELEPGYSEATSKGRREVLEQARNATIVASKTFKTRKGPPDGVSVETRLVPGALALLQQVAEYEILIGIGETFLESQDSVPVASDVMFSMGLAKLGQADENFQIPKASSACLRMVEAHQLLVQTGTPPVAEDLVKDIEESMLSLAPRSVLDQLQLPLSMEQEKDRQEAIEILKDLMAPNGESKRTLFDRPVDRHFVKDALDKATSQEVLGVVDWYPIIKSPKSRPWFYPGLLMKVAMAHIVVAFTHRRPSLLEDLEKIFALPGKAEEAHVEKVITHVLLGEPEKALTFLAETEGTWKKWKSRSRSRLRSRSRFLDNDGGSADGEAEEEKPNTGIGAKTLPGRHETLAFIKANSPITENGATKEANLLDGLCLFTQRWLELTAMPHFRDTYERPPTVCLTEYFDDSKVIEYLTTKGGNSPYDPKVRVKTTAPSPSLESKSAEKGSKQKKQKKTAKGGKDEAAKNDKSGAKSGSTRKPSPLLIALAGGAVLGAALFSYVYQPFSSEEYEYDTLTEAQRLTINKLNVENPMSIALAENIVKKWQFAKSSALGPQHEVKYMGKILSADLAQTWRDRVADVAEQKLHWKYKLTKCKVTNVDASQFDGGYGHVTISVQLAESASMHDANGKALDKYKTSYKVAYEVILDTDGKWRINNINVIRV